MEGPQLSSRTTESPVPVPGVGVAAALLCAGAGSRYDAGRPGGKLVAPWRGRPLVLWAVENVLAARLGETFVVTGAADLTAVLPDGVTVVENRRWRDGLATSLHAAVSAARSAGFSVLVVGLGDQPLIGPEAWRSVAAAEGQIAVATYEGLRRNPVKLARAVWDLVPTTGDEGPGP